MNSGGTEASEVELDMGTDEEANENEAESLELDAEAGATELVTAKELLGCETG